MLDLSLKAEGPLTADAAVAAQEVPSFVSLVNAAVSAAPQEALQLANTVTVQPGGKTFSTVTDAMNSITDAKLQKQYVVQIGPGTYNEVVVCKPYVFLAGAGVSVTTITAPASANQWDKGTVKAASNSAVQNMTILSMGNGWGSWATAVDCTAAVNFDIENCNLEANATDNGPNLVTLAVDYSAAGGGSQINVAYTMVGAHGGAQPIGILVYARGYVNVNDSKIVADGAGTAWGGSASNGAAIELYGSTVLGTMSLVLSDASAHITAKNCTLIGPYSPGVVVVPSSGD
ncbi:MAG: pectinesterase family protein [Acidobacteriota bacterium]